MFVKILDVNGNVVDDEWKANKDTARTQYDNPTKYEFIDSVYRDGSYTGNADVSGSETIRINVNEFFFYMPQINSLDFEHMNIYQIQLMYGNNTRTILFAALDPIKLLYPPPEKPDPCVDYKNKLIRLNNTLSSLKNDLIRLEATKQMDRAQKLSLTINSIEKQIISLQNC